VRVRQNTMADVGFSTSRMRPSVAILCARETMYATWRTRGAEPAGTTSLGWGPLLRGGTLTIPVLATRVAPGAITFDLQILSGEAVLRADGAPAWLQVEVP